MPVRFTARAARVSRSDARHPPAGTPTFTLTKVPEITILFWGLTLLTTGMGEAISDSLGQRSVPLAGFVGIFGLAFVLWLQLRRPQYRAPYYWLAVMMVAVFGTMAADGVHDGIGMPYSVTTPVFATTTAGIFFWWYRSERTPVTHSVTTCQRECVYWAAVLSTCALGTAAGDLTATQINLGFWPSTGLFAAAISVPAIGWWQVKWNPVVSFWLASIVTRPLGASVADGFSKNFGGGLKVGDPLVSLIAFIGFAGLVTYATVSRCDVAAHGDIRFHEATDDASSIDAGRLAYASD